MRGLVVSVPIADADVAADILWQLGVRAIEERPSTEGTVELWTTVGDAADATTRARRALGERWAVRVVELETTAADTWRDFAGPMWVDDALVIVPAWQADPRLAGAGDPTTAAVAVAIEPGGAFGLGDHPTTLLSVRAARRHLHDAGEVLDVGCGTGVIAVVAAVTGGVPVRAVDVASAAVEATRDNAERNGVADLVEADTTPLGDLDGCFDLVVANILAPTLIALAADLRRLTAAGGRLVVSGILADRHDHVLAALAPMLVERTDTLDGWAAVTLRHPA
jgi:ribosomal protein L11 methyltransferase